MTRARRPPSGPFSNPEEPSRDIYAARLVEDFDERNRGRKRRLVDGLAAAFGILVQKIRGAAGQSTRNKGADLTAAAVSDAGGLAASAVAGKLEGASLEGELKRAQIAREFAEARKTNAEAAKIEADAAWDQVERALRLADLMGARPELMRLKDGTPCLGLGEGFSSSTPDEQVRVRPQPRSLSQSETEDLPGST